MYQYKITKIHYRDIFGKLLFKTDMLFSRLHGIGEIIVEDHTEYIVQRVAVADNIQHVNLAPVKLAGVLVNQERQGINCPPERPRSEVDRPGRIGRLAADPAHRQEARQFSLRAGHLG